MRKVERPSYRENGQYQFIVWYTGGGNPECVHLSPEEISERLRAQVGPGTLVDDGLDLWWEQVDTSEVSSFKGIEVPAMFSYEFEVMIKAAQLTIGDKLLTKSGGLSFGVREVNIVGEEVMVTLASDARPVTFKITDHVLVVR